MQYCKKQKFHNFMSKLQQLSTSDVRKVAEELDYSSIEDLKHSAGVGQGQYNTNVDPDNGELVFTPVNRGNGPDEIRSGMSTSVRP